jgi:alanine racemase
MSQSPTDSRVSFTPPCAQLTVRLKALAANYREAKRRSSPAEIAPVVKADAYRIGMVPVAGALAAEGVDMFFVARLEEGMALRALVPRARIFVFDGVAYGTAPALINHRLTPVLNSLEEISEWSRAALARKSTLDAALHLDTGMNRSGLPEYELERLAPKASEMMSGINLALILSHLACADEPSHAKNREQLDKFRAALAMLPSAPASLSASAGIDLGSEYLFDVVRLGMGLYGGNPIPSRPNPYRTVAVLTSRVLQIRKLEAGETVGYGATFTATRPTKLAIVAMGYADGMMRSASGKGHAAIASLRVPIVGRISMDLLALDATAVPDEVIQRGVEVEFLGDTISLEEAAAAAGTINHEALTSISPRVHRIYVGD